MGSVWKATHQTLDRCFAVKFMKDLCDGDVCAQERFLAEARMAAAVRHACVVDVVDYGTTDEGTPYMVMEYLEGESLARRLERDPVLPVAEFVRLMASALTGLEAVHQASILHRDLKPENIVLCRDVGELLPKLIDFGISRVVEPADGSDQARRLTGPGTTLGTPWYMAPEHARGLQDMDRRGDIYAAGVVIYEGLTGKVPFDHEDPRMLLMLVAAGGAAPVAALRPDLPEKLSALVAKAMHPDPDRRFATAAQLAAALRALLPSLPATAMCRARGRGASASVADAPGSPLTGSANATLSVDGARDGLRPLRKPAALFAGAAVLGALALALALGLAMGRPGQSATARGGAPPSPVVAARGGGMTPISLDRARPAEVILTAAGTPAAAPAAPEAPKPHRVRPRAPDIFRTPGF